MSPSDDPTRAEDFVPELSPEADPANDSGALVARCAALEEELARMKDQALRALAEAENTRRRAERDREDAIKYATTNFARDLLSVSDNFTRALDSIPADLRTAEGPLSALVSGIEATARALQTVFERFGVRPIDAQGQIFNPNLHEVLFEIPGSGAPAGTVLQVIERGYTIHDRLLRPARVGVAKAEPGEAQGGGHIDQMA